MSLYKQLQLYFSHVINATEFIIALDATGVYLFKKVALNNTTIAHARKLLQILALEEDEAKLIFVVPQSDCSYDSFAYEESSVRNFALEVGAEDVEDVVRKLTGVRNIIFKPADIDSIIDCFQDVKRELTDFQKYLVELGLTEDEAVAFEVARPDSINDLVELGCPMDLVEVVYKAFCDYYEVNNADFEKLDTNNYVTIETNMKKYRLGGMLLTCAAIVLWSMTYTMPAMKLYFSIALLLLGVIAENMLSKSIKLRDTTLARIGFVINIALLAIVVAPAAGMWIVTHAISLFNKVDSFNAVQWFENVHW